MSKRKPSRSNRIPADRMTLIFVGLLLVPFICGFGYKYWLDKQVDKIKKAGIIYIDKENMVLELQDYQGRVIMKTGIACGKNYGNKQGKGDMRTPEGLFHISDIQDASGWDHDFNDGNGKIAGAYGPWFLRLETPGHSGIGIHGTHDPNSIGTRATEGCIRLKNADIEKLKDLVYIGMPVAIVPSAKDIAETAKVVAETKEEKKEMTETKVPLDSHNANGGK